MHSPRKTSDGDARAQGAAASRRRLHCRATAASAVLMALPRAICLAQTASDDEVSVTPCRPSISTPAALFAASWMEIEAGLLAAHGAGTERRGSVPCTLKLAFMPDGGMRLGGDGWVRPGGLTLLGPHLS
jgi:hypothetical protein